MDTVTYMERYKALENIRSKLTRKAMYENEGEDVVQEAYLRTYNALQDGAVPDGMDVSYLWSSLRSAIYNSRRMRQREQRAYMKAQEDVCVGMVGTGALHLPRPDDVVHARHILDRIGVPTVVVDRLLSAKVGDERLERVVRAIAALAR